MEETFTDRLLHELSIAASERYAPEGAQIVKSYDGFAYKHSSDVREGDIPGEFLFSFRIKKNTSRSIGVYHGKIQIDLDTISPLEKLSQEEKNNFFFEIKCSYSLIQFEHIFKKYLGGIRLKNIHTTCTCAVTKYKCAHVLAASYMAGLKIQKNTVPTLSPILLGDEYAVLLKEFEGLIRAPLENEPMEPYLKWPIHRSPPQKNVDYFGIQSDVENIKHVLGVFTRKLWEKPMNPYHAIDRVFDLEKKDRFLTKYIF